MGLAAAEKAAFAAGRPTWARIGGGNGPKILRTRFIICYLLGVSLGKVPAVGAARWSASWQGVGLGAERPGGAVQFRRGGGGRARAAPAVPTYIQPRRKFYHCQPAYE